MRIILNTGKGGVGKTTISAATSLAIAKNKKTLVTSTDMAHSLSDSFDIKLSSKPTFIKENLYGLEIDPVEESKKSWGQLHSYLKEVIEEKANSSIEFDEMLLFPGFDDLFSLLRILEIVEEDQYEVLVVDCAPTGESLSMLSYSEKIEVFADSIVPMVQNFNRGFGSLIQKRTTVPKPKDIVFDEFRELAKKLSKLDKILHDKDKVSLRIVTSPENIVIDEAIKNYSYLKLYDFGVDAVFVNKIYPKEFLEDGLEDLEKVQNKNLEKIQDHFVNEKIFKSDLKSFEMRGTDQLEILAGEIFENEDPYEIYTKDQSYFFIEDTGTRILHIKLPYANQKSIKVFKEGPDLIINYSFESRRLHLDTKLANRKLTKYEYQEPFLKVYMDY